MRKLASTRTSRQAYSGSEQTSFLPEPDFNPIFPSLHSLKNKCLKALLQGGVLNHPDFEKITGSWRLAAVVHELIKMGWPIVSYDLPAPSNDSPNRYISFYYLPEKYILKAREVCNV